jgi:hypothetical protein
VFKISAISAISAGNNKKTRFLREIRTSDSVRNRIEPKQYNNEEEH